MFWKIFAGVSMAVLVLLGAVTVTVWNSQQNQRRASIERQADQDACTAAQVAGRHRYGC